MTLRELLVGVNVLKNTSDPEMHINNVCIDSRDVSKGDMFVCISGNKVDGHYFADVAVKKRACVLICERQPQLTQDAEVIIVDNSRKAIAVIAANLYGNPARELKLIGITGTNGKTTSTYLVKCILESVGKKVGLIGTNQNLVGNEILPSTHTTPDALELHRLLRRMKDSNCEYVVMEVSSHALHMNRVYGCNFEVAGFTNLTPEHIDYHKSMESYFDTKRILFENCSWGIVNCDDEYGRRLLQMYPDILSSFSVNENSWLKASRISLLKDSVSFSLDYENKNVEFYLSIPGEFSVYNAVLAVGICIKLGVDIGQCSQGLKNAKGVCGRIEVIPVNKDYTVIIDYAHTPDGLVNILKAVRGFCRGRLILLFGCGGDRDNSKRAVMGEIGLKMADYCVITSDNPRTEPPDKIIKDILRGVPEGCEDRYIVIENRFEAIKYSLSIARKDDVVLLAGKGHENYQILKDRTIEFNEHEIVLSLVN